MYYRDVHVLGGLADRKWSICHVQSTYLIWSQPLSGLVAGSRRHICFVVLPKFFSPECHGTIKVLPFDTFSEFFWSWQQLQARAFV